MSPRTRHFFRELLGQSLFLVLGAVPLGLGLWLATRNGTAPPSVWLLAGAGALILVGGFLVWHQLAALREAVSRFRALPPLRRPPTDPEIAAYRARLERALAALAATPDPLSAGLPGLAEALRREHANAAAALREPVAAGFHRWAGGELDLASWGPAYAKACDALAAVSAHHARYGPAAAEP